MVHETSVHIWTKIMGAFCSCLFPREWSAKTPIPQLERHSWWCHYTRWNRRSGISLLYLWSTLTALYSHLGGFKASSMGHYAHLGGFKASSMGHYVIVSLWCASLSNNTRFCFLYFRMNNCQVHMMLHQEKELPNGSGKTLSYNNFTNKKQNGCC